MHHWLECFDIRSLTTTVHFLTKNWHTGYSYHSLLMPWGTFKHFCFFFVLFCFRVRSLAGQTDGQTDEQAA